MKPMLAEDAVDAKIKFPVLVQPKIDGVRGLNLGTGLTGRSLKPHANLYTTRLFTCSDSVGIDGELTANDWAHPRLCNLTTSALNTIKGEPYLVWWAFDYIVPFTLALPYSKRYALLEDRVAYLRASVGPLDIRVVPSQVCTTMEQVLDLENYWLDTGMEGVILRDPNGLYKNGRSTVREGGLLRIKRFVEEDAVVLSVVEGETNNNAEQTNELGHTFRTTHQENMVPNECVGSLICQDVKTSNMITVAAGKMTHPEREFYFHNQKHIIGTTIKYQHFPKGVKDKPRFPTFQSFRSPSDISK